jgi:hypothetical protein
MNKPEFITTFIFEKEELVIYRIPDDVELFYAESPPEYFSHST